MPTMNEAEFDNIAFPVVDGKIIDAVNDLEVCTDEWRAWYAARAAR